MKKIVICAFLLCLILTACGQVVQGDPNSGTTATTTPTSQPSLLQSSTQITAPSRVSTTVPTSAASTVSTNPTVDPTTSSTSSKPPISLAIRNNDEYENLLLAAKDEQVYQAGSMYRMVFDTHEELVAFVKLLSHLPVPSIADAKSVTLRYYPNIAQLRIEQVVKQTHFYRYTYILDKDDAEENRRTLSEQKQMLDKEINVNKDANINAISQFGIRWEDSKVYRGWLDMDGWLVMVEVRNDDADISSKSITEVLEPMTIKNTPQFPVADSAELTTTVPSTAPSAVLTTPTVTITLPGTLVPVFPPETSNPRTS